jgi:hypothetical protein
MSLGKKNIPDFIPAGTEEPKSSDPTDEYRSAVDNGRDFTDVTTDSSQGLADPDASTGTSMPA